MSITIPTNLKCSFKKYIIRIKDCNQLLFSYLLIKYVFNYIQSFIDAHHNNNSKHIFKNSSQNQG